MNIVIGANVVTKIVKQKSIRPRTYGVELKPFREKVFRTKGYINTLVKFVMPQKL